MKARSVPCVFACHHGAATAVFEHASLFEGQFGDIEPHAFYFLTAIGSFIGTIASVQLLKPPLSIDIDMAM
jgi:hypothetical protein